MGFWILWKFEGEREFEVEGWIELSMILDEINGDLDILEKYYDGFGDGCIRKLFF